MASFAWASLSRSLLPTANTTIYTVPSGVLQVAIIDIEFVLAEAARSARVWVYLVPAGGSPGPDNALIDGWKLTNPNTRWNGFRVLGSVGDTVVARADRGNTVTIHVDGGVLR